MPKDKTDNFLQAIKKHAKTQKSAMQGEVKQLKNERLKEAEEQAQRDSQRLIKEKLLEYRSRRTAELAKMTQEGQKKLFVERSAMVDEVFQMAADKLRAFAESDRYADELKENAEAIAGVFGDNDCVLYLNERDLGAADMLTGCFSGNVEVEADKTIKIGGVRGYCKSMGIIADETLDNKLDAQREWFIEHAALSVL